MARSRSQSSIEAEKLYHEGMKLVDIAKKFGVPAGTVRRWKSTQNWDRNKSEQGKKKETERSGKKNPNARKVGAPYGNKNSVGHAPSVPLRNKNAEKHGAFSKFYLDSFSEEELEMINGMDDSEEYQLILQLQVFSARERWLMGRIKKFRESEDEKHGLLVKSISKTKKTEDITDFNGKSIGSGAFKKETETSVTKTEAVLNSIMALEGELTKVQKAKTKTIETLARYRLEEEKTNKDGGNGIPKTWVEKILESRRQS